MQTDIEKSVYMFVHKNYYNHGYDLSTIIRNMRVFYCNRINSDMIEYAVSLYCMFSDSRSSSPEPFLAEAAPYPEEEFEQLKF